VYVLENLDHAELRHALMYEVFDMYGATDHAHRRDWSADLKKLFDARRAKGMAAMAAAAAAAKPAGGAEPSMPLDKYVGAYTDSTYGTITVTLDGGALHAKYVNFDIGELKHGSFERFESVKKDTLEGTTELTFVPDGRGHVSAVRFSRETFPRDETSSKK
jgi:hypothetical protein